MNTNTEESLEKIYAEKPKKEIEHIKDKKNKLNEKIRISKDFYDEFIVEDIKKEILFNNEFGHKINRTQKKHKVLQRDLSINAFKIIFNTIQFIRDKQFQKTKEDVYPKQLKMFEEEYISEDNTYARITLSNNLISSNPERIIKAYEELSLFKYGIYTSKNSLGKEIKVIGGFVTNVAYNRGKTTFLLSSYWLKKLIDISVYSDTYYNMVYNTKSQENISFWFWLSFNVGVDFKTILTLEEANNIFDTNYNTTESFCEKYLAPKRKFLNKYSKESFNFGRNEESKTIWFLKYPVKTLAQEAVLEDKTLKRQEYYQFIEYLSKRHKFTEDMKRNLSEHNSKEGLDFIFRITNENPEGVKIEGIMKKDVFPIIKSAYELLKDDMRKNFPTRSSQVINNRRKLTDIQGVEFANIFNTYLKEAYKRFLLDSNDYSEQEWEHFKSKNPFMSYRFPIDLTYKFPNMSEVERQIQKMNKTI